MRGGSAATCAGISRLRRGSEFSGRCAAPKKRSSAADFSRSMTRGVSLQRFTIKYGLQ